MLLLRPAGFVGAPVFYCISGEWVAPPESVANGCQASSGSCAFDQLPGLPDSTTGWENCDSSASSSDLSGWAEEGFSCFAACDPTATAGGRPMTQCKGGQWTQIAGECVMVSEEQGPSWQYVGCVKSASILRATG